MILIKGDFLQLLKLSSVIIVFILLFSSCQDDPTSLGKDLIDNQLEIKTLNSDTDSSSQHSSSFLSTTFLVDSIGLGSSGRVLIGNLDYVKSTTLMKFGTILPDSTIASIEANTLTIVSAQVELRPIYKVGDVSQIFDFSVHQITSKWGSAAFNSDSLSMLAYEQNELTDNKVVTDSLITFDLDKEIALEWLEALSGDSLVNNYGVIFMPKGGNNLIYGFEAYSSSISDDIPILKYIVKNEDDKIDTLTTFSVFDVHILEGEVPQVPENRIQLTAGFGQRGKLFFDLSKLPLNININKAELTMHLDSVNSVVGSPDADLMEVYMYADSTELTIDDDESTSNLYFNGSEFTGEITRFVQAVVSGKENQGFELSLSNEIEAVDRYVIYGSKYSDRSLRPKLVIYYNVFD